MTETSPSAAPGPPPLPTMSSVGSMRLLRGWLEGPARWIGWLIIPIVPALIVAPVAAVEASYACYSGTTTLGDGSYSWEQEVYDQGCVYAWLSAAVVVYLVLILLAALSLASAFSMLTRRKSRGDRAAVATRLQGAKDWFIRGAIEEADYDRLRKAVESTSDSKGQAATAASGATLLRSFAILLLPLGFLWVMLTGFTIDSMPGLDSDLAAFLVTWTMGGLVLLSLVVGGLVRASALGRFGREAGDALLREVDKLEAEIMNSARARTGAPGLPSTAGASFRAYGRR